MRRVFIASFMALVATPLVPAQANHLPLVHEFTAEGGSWGAYRFRTKPGTTVEWQFTSTLLDSRAYGGGAWLLNADGSVATFFLNAGYSGITNEVHVEGPAPVGVVADDHNDGMFGEGGASSGWQFNVAKEWVIVTVSTGDGQLSSNLKLFASPEVDLVKVTTGTDTFMRTEADFGGGANVVAGGCAIRFVVCGKAKGVALGSTTGVATNRMFASFGGSIEAVVSSVDRPGQPGSPALNSGLVVSNESPGTYRFNVHANAGASYSGLSAWGADVTLPVG